MSEPRLERTTDGAHQCACVLDGDQCTTTVESTDNPFCVDCEERHPQQDPSRVSAVMPVRTP